MRAAQPTSPGDAATARPRAHPRLESVSRPKQARSQQTLYRILEAAESLIEEQGLADASIPEIVRRAGSSVGGFYARFKDKNELLRALEERFFREVLAKLERLAEPTRWEGVELQAVVAACVAELVSTVRAREQLLKAFIARAAQDSRYAEDGLRLRRLMVTRIAGLMAGRRAELTHPEPDLAVELGVQFALGFMLEHVLFGGTWASGRHLGDAELEREITRVFFSYVAGPEASPPAAPAESDSSAPPTSRRDTPSQSIRSSS